MCEPFASRLPLSSLLGDRRNSRFPTVIALEGDQAILSLHDVSLGYKRNKAAGANNGGTTAPNQNLTI
ncbi:hypothetical protein RRG08_044097 [Elysia crispata]|uniref:Uncharacterized protein n=1 Tax=Elysia crispata TaxID=231223 RepID=A0AAE0Z7B2_9GAST|nr:hypothetical protein RRG08_044097 [Elysia crispata]